MNIVLTSFGSMGDMQPMFALAVELKRAGHHPVLALPANFEHHARRLNVEFKKVGPEISGDNVEKHGRNKTRAEDTGNNNEEIPDAIANAKYFVQAFAPMIPQMIEELSEACKNADVLVSTTFQFAAKIVHEKLKIPLVTILLSHFSVNGSKLLRESTAPIINEYRVKEGLSPLDDPLTVDALSDNLVLFAVSKLIMRRSQNWPGYYHVTGFFFLEEHSYVPGAELQKFLTDNPKPVIISFGSMVHEDPDHTMDILIESVIQSGKSAIIQKGWSGLNKSEIPPNIYLIDYLPHSWLFPQGSCIVHHGGAGTTAAALLSGVPAVIVPHALDQPLWAQMGMALGCVKAVIPFHDLDAEKLSNAIRETINNEKCVEKALKMKDKIRAEEGVKQAAKLIEELITGKPG